MTIKIYPESEGEYILYEDDGISFEFEKGIYAKTRFSYTCNGDKLKVCIDEKEGEYTLPTNREYHIEVYTDEPTKLPDNVIYDTDKKAICFTLNNAGEFVI